MAARRCPIGCESWPNEPIFNVCATCGEATRYISNAEPTLSREEAVSRKLHFLFDRYYERICDKRGIPVDGPLDEDLRPAH
jgi:hypothetical protein